MNPLRFIDEQLNRYTMYRGLLFGLTGLLVLATVLAYAGRVAISGTGLLLGTAVLIASCYLANYVFGYLYNAARNSESWLITALILACILPQATTLTKTLYIALAGFIAMASKYLLTFRSSHIFNPAAVGAFVLTITGLLPATWWIATPWLMSFTIALALVTLRKQRMYPLFIVFALAATAMSLYVGTVLHGQDIGIVLKNAFVSLPLLFMGSIMLTEPSTLPPTRFYQLLLGGLVGVFYASQLSLGPVSASPEASLIVAGLFTLLAAPAYGALVRIKSVTQLSPSIYDVSFEKPTGLKFMPGQYMEWTLPHAKADFRGNRRMFSIASSPTEPDLHIGIRATEHGSSFKRALLSLKKGGLVRLAHVSGSFTLPDDNQPVLLIAGGIGITPFRSMIQNLIDSEQSRDIILVYSAAAKEDFVYTDVFKAAKAHGLQTHITTERLSAEQLKQLVPDIAARTVFISGPPAMVRGYRTIARALTVPVRNIRTDHFSGY